MPELPEVETMRRGLLPIVGRRFAEIITPPCTCKPILITPSLSRIRSALIGERVAGIGRLGKRVLVETKDWTLIFQPKMTGLTTLAEAPDPEHVRLQIVMKGNPKLAVQFWDRRGLGTVELLPKEQVQARIVDGRLGPDALDISAQEFHRRLTATARPVKVALLDQKILAGVGNLYASEMLHVARIHPTMRAENMTRKQTDLLHSVMLDILQTAILYEGSTLSDGTYRNSLNDAGGYQNAHRVYDRAGELCPTCLKCEIERIVQAQRSTFFCPRCQKQDRSKR